MRKQLASDLEQTLQKNKQPLDRKIQLEETSDYLKTINYATATVRKQLKALEQKRESKKHALQNRRELLAKDRALREETLKRIESDKKSLQGLVGQHTKVKADITQQRRRVANDLSKIYPITPLPDRSLAFTIRGVHLPNSENLDSATSPESLAAALGHVSHTLQLLSLYLHTILPDPPPPRSSTSTIHDPISTLHTPSNTKAPTSTTNNPQQDLASRTFPLFSKGAVRFRFEYGVFLLNKDIEILLSTAFGVRVLDIRQTLPNLLYVVYCATAGEGELPARRAGGVRALMRERGRAGGSFESDR